MIKRSMLLASTGLGLTLAFDNEPGWKMDGDKIAVDGNGDPIYIDAQGRESAIKHDTIASRNAEAKANRERAEKAEADLKKFVGADGKPLDPDAAKKAIETVSKIDAKQLIDAGKVDELTDQIKSQFTAQLQEKDQALAQLTETNRTMLIDKAFDASEFIGNNIAVPRDMFRDSFGRNVKVGEDGKLEFYGRDGNRLLSKKHAGDYATGDEAFELMVEQHPQKDTILKAPEAGGTGNSGQGGQRGGQRRISRTDFEAMPAAKQGELAGQMAKGEVSIVD